MMRMLLLWAPLLWVAQGSAQDERSVPPDGGLTQTLTMIAIALVFFYFILWRPEQKRRQLLEDQRSSIKVGDKVIAMGIIGIVQKIQDDSVILKMVDGAKIEVLKGAITQVVDAATKAPEEKG